MSIIADGTGRGYKAEVTSQNKLKIDGVVEDAFVDAAENGRAFNINTFELNISGTGPFTQDLLYVKNNGTTDIEIVGWFIGEANNRTGGNTAGPILFEMFGSPTGATSGTSVPVVNRRIGDPTVFDLDCIAEPVGLTKVNSPLLYQYHYGGRAFGTVNFTIPSGASIVLTGNFECDSCSLYTGFTGYTRT